MSRPNPLASVVVLNFNGERYLADCLGSLSDQSYAPLEVVVADNGSSDRSGEIAASYPVRWLPLQANHGFARGNNLAAAACAGEFLIFVNNDMRFARGFVENLCAPLLCDPSLFATDARQLDWAGHAALRRAVRLERRPWLDSVFRPGWIPGLRTAQIDTDGPVKVFQACGGSMAVRRSFFEELGGFDDRFPASWEDTEICWRAWLRGWGSVHVPSAVCRHAVGAASATAEGRDVRLRGALQGRLRFATRHLPLEHCIATWAASVAGSVTAALRGRVSRAGKQARLIVSTFGSVPPLLRERRREYAAANTTPRAHLGTLLGTGAPWRP